MSLELLDQRCETYINDLDDALTIIEKLGILYETLSQSDQRELLRNVVERVVVNTEGAIDRVEYLPPFAYLQAVRDRVNDAEQRTPRRTSRQTKKTTAWSPVRVKSWIMGAPGLEPGTSVL